MEPLIVPATAKNSNENLNAAREAGANIIASGSFILKSDDIEEAVRALSE